MESLGLGSSGVQVEPTADQRLPPPQVFARKKSFPALKLTRNGTKNVKIMPRNTQNDKKTHKEVNQWIFVAPGMAFIL